MAPFDYRVVGNTPDPSTVTQASGLVTYEFVRATPATLLVEMMGTRTIRVEVFPDKTAVEVFGFTAAAQTYIR